MGNSGSRSNSLSSSASCGSLKSLDKDSQAPSSNDDKRGDIRSRYKIQHVLGAGTFGEVRQATLLEDPETVRAVKIIEISSDMEEVIHRELRVHQSLQHPNIVQLWEAYQDNHFVYMVMDLCPGGEVFGKISQLGSFTEVDAAGIGKQMLTAVEYIHARGIMHRDIKAENFLLSNESLPAVVKLIDFGMAVKFEHEQVFSELCGSPHYLSPEQMGQVYTHRVDMWAVGVTLYLMLFGQYPWDGEDMREIMLKILNSKVRFKRAKVSTLSNSAVHLLQGCLEKKPRKRLSAQEALKHPWIVKAGRPDDGDGAFHDSNLIESVQSAEKVVTATRGKAPEEVQQRRENTLQKLDANFKKGILCHGRRLPDAQQEDFMSKPETLRRNNGIVTAPSGLLGQKMQSFRAKVAAKVDAARGKNTVEKADCGIQQEMEEETTDAEIPLSVPAKAKSLRGRMHSAQSNDEEVHASLRKLWQSWRRETPHGGETVTTDFHCLCPSTVSSAEPKSSS